MSADSTGGRAGVLHGHQARGVSLRALSRAKRGGIFRAVLPKGANQARERPRGGRLLAATDCSSYRHRLFRAEESFL